MNRLEDFLMDSFEEAEEVEKVIEMGGRERTIRLKPITSKLGDEIRKKCRKVKMFKGQKITETDQDKYMDNLIIETVTCPDFKNAELQSSWGVMGAEELLNAMKGKMIDGEYAELNGLVSEINGYDKGMEDMIAEAKN